MGNPSGHTAGQNIRMCITDYRKNLPKTTVRPIGNSTAGHRSVFIATCGLLADPNRALGLILMLALSMAILIATCYNDFVVSRFLSPFSCSRFAVLMQAHPRVCTTTRRHASFLNIEQLHNRGDKNGSHYYSVLWVLA